jgi:hypothetical protein
MTQINDTHLKTFFNSQRHFLIQQKVDLAKQSSSTRNDPLKEFEELIAKNAEHKMAYAEVLNKDIADLLASDNLFLRYPLSDKLFAHIHAANIIKNSCYEGMNLEESLGFLIFALEQLKGSADSHKVEKLVQDLKGCLDWVKHSNMMMKLEQNMKEQVSNIPKEQATKEWDKAENHIRDEIRNLADQLIGQIKGLKKGERLLLPGGWAGNPGHAMLYEIIRDDSCFTFRLFNTGDGVQYHEQNIFEKRDHNDKEKIFYHPILEITNILSDTLEALCLWEALLTARIRRVEFNSKDLYQVILPLLRGKIKSSAITRENSVEKQKAGTCAWKVLTALIKFRLGHEAQKILLYQMKFWSLAAFFKQKDKQQISYSERLLIKEAADNLARHALKMHAYQSQNAACPSLLDSFRVYALTASILKELEVREQAEIFITQRQSMEFSPITQNQTAFPNFFQTPFHCEEKQMDDPSDEMTRACFPPQTKLTLDPTQLAGDLSNQLNVCQTTEEDLRLKIHLANLFGQLPIPVFSQEDIWNQLSLHDQLSSMASLSALMQMYMHMFDEFSFRLNSKHLIDIHSVYAIMDKLARLLLRTETGESLLDGLFLPLSLTFNNFIDDDWHEIKRKIEPEDISHCHADDPKTNARLKQIFDYFEQTATHSILFLNFNENAGEHLSLEIKNQYLETNGDVIFLKRLLDHDSDLKKQIEIDLTQNGQSTALHRILAELFIDPNGKYLPQAYRNLREIAIGIRILCCTSPHFKLIKDKSDNNKSFIGICNPDRNDQLISTSFHDLYWDGRTDKMTKLPSPFRRLFFGNYGQNEGLAGIAAAKIEKDEEEGAKVGIKDGPSPNETAQLVKIHCESALQTWSLLAFYKKNLILLERDAHFNYLLCCLTQANILIDQLKENPQLIEIIQDFVLCGHAFFSSASQFRTLINLINLALMFEKFIVHVYPNKAYCFLNYRQRLERLISQHLSDLSDPDKSLLYKALIETFFRHPSLHSHFCCRPCISSF